MASFSVSGSLMASDPTWNRPDETYHLSPDYPYYDLYPFYVTQNGTYGVHSCDSATTFDTVLALYDDNGFDSLTPLTGVIAVGDDWATCYAEPLKSLLSVVETDLTANVQYYAVATAFDTGTTGDYRLTFYGRAGVADPILGLLPSASAPEPATAALLISGIAALGFCRRRRAATHRGYLSRPRMDGGKK
jgi:hypothetical protein